MSVRSRVVTALTLLSLGVFQSISGLVLFFAPTGRFSGRYEILGLKKEVWKDLHSYTGFIIISLAILHLVLNWNILKAELKRFLNG